MRNPHRSLMRNATRSQHVCIGVAKTLLMAITRNGDIHHG